MNEKKREWKGKERTRQLLAMVEEKVYNRQSENRGRCGNIWENPKLTRSEWAGTNAEEGGGERREPGEAAEWRGAKGTKKKRQITKMAR